MNRTLFLAAATGCIALTATAWAQTTGASPPGQASDSILSLLVKGGPVMIPLAICSIVALTLALERFMTLSRAKILPPTFMDSLRSTIVKEKQLHWRHGLELCQEVDAPLSRLMRSGIVKRGESAEYRDKAMADTAAMEVGRMRRSLRGMKVIAAISPLLGLLGTVAGMIRSFQTVALSTGSLGRAEMLAQGIYEAMVTTATGLAIAIPVLVLYYFLFNRVDKLADALELEGEGFLDFLREVQRDPELSDAKEAPKDEYSAV